MQKMRPWTFVEDMTPKFIFVLRNADSNLTVLASAAQLP